MYIFKAKWYYHSYHPRWEHSIKEKPAETTTTCLSFSSRPIPQLEEEENGTGSKTLGILRLDDPSSFFSNSFQFLAHFNAWKTSSSPDSSWIASSRKYLIRLNIYIYILFQIFIFHSKLPITKPFLFVSNINIRISQIILRFLPRSISGSSRILPRIQEKFVGSVLAEAMKDSSKNKANGRNWAVV